MVPLLLARGWGCEREGSRSGQNVHVGPTLSASELGQVESMSLLGRRGSGQSGQHRGPSVGPDWGSRGQPALFPWGALGLLIVVSLLLPCLPGSANPRPEHRIPFCSGRQDPGPILARQGADDLDQGKACR